MPIHLDALDVAASLEQQCSALIVPCYMCPAVTAAVNEQKPFLQLFSHFLKSPPFERHIKTLQTSLEEHGIEADVFRSNIVHQWFLCMWTRARRRKLKRKAVEYDYLIVLGCDSATETVRDLFDPADIAVIQGMEVTGFTNAKMRFRLPGNITFEDSRIVPLPRQTAN